LFMFLVTFILIYTVIVPSKVTNKFKAYYTKSLCNFATTFLQGIWVKVYGKENLKGLKNVLVYSNHKSKADPQILIKSFKGPVAFTPKKDLYSVFLLKHYFNALGCMCVDRDSTRETAKQIIKTSEHIKNGVTLVMHPEGGICSREVEVMLDMKPGAYKFAKLTQVPIVPVALINTSQIHKKFPFFVPIKVQVHILEPLLSEQYKNWETAEIAKYVFDKINDKIESINGKQPLPKEIKYYGT